MAGASSPQELLDRVLVVDDDRLSREMLSDTLGDRAQVECCPDAESALEALRREPAHLVISDLVMPGMSGVELLEEIERSHPGTDFVLLTANATVESAVGALRMGAADYLTKPINAQELSHVVDRILSRRRLLAENDQLRDTLRTVESCRSLARCLEPGEVYAVALDLLLQHLPRQRGLALFQRSTVPMADGVAFRGFDEREARALRDLLVGEKPIDADAAREIEIVSDGPLHEVFRSVGVACDSFAIVPVRSDRETGVLWLCADGRPFSDEEIERVKLIAGHADLALRNAERYSEAKERAFTDDVTDVFNARYLLQATDREIQRAERFGNPLSVLFLDLDRFKTVNDQFGHLVGSRALRRLSEVLLGCIRQVDTLARYGGDEFTILLVDTDYDVALLVAERIRATVSETLFEAGRDAPFRLSISIGVATYPSHAHDRSGLLDLSDKAMYRAKSLGRNCVCGADDLEG